MPDPARPLAEGRWLVAVVVDPAVWFDREIVAGAAQFAREAGDWMLYVEEEAPDRLPDLRSWRGHGIIGSFHDPRVARLIATSGLPAVAVGGSQRPDASDGIPCVNTDNEAIAELAAAHLLECGLRSFGYYGTVVSDTTAWSHARGDAFVARITAAGHPCDRLTATHPSRHWSTVQGQLEAWLRDLPKPVGIMACDDTRARHVLESCRALGLRVPHEVAVIGVDNDELICELAVPQLTSIAQSGRRIGYEAARLLDRLMRQELRPASDAAAAPPVERGLIPPVGVVARASTDTLAVSDPVIAGVIRLIRDRRVRDLSVQDLVAASGLSRWKLEARFKELVGHSIHDDIARARLTEAMRLIRTTDLPLKAVAPRSGFRSVPYMITMFRRHFGVTPAKLRKHEQRGIVRNATDDEPTPAAARSPGDTAG